MFYAVVFWQLGFVLAGLHLIVEKAANFPAFFIE
jgi:hypothetical protein